jgi:hypothetical protein
MDLDYYEVRSSIIHENKYSYRNEGIMDQLKEELDKQEILKALEQDFIYQNNENEDEDQNNENEDEDGSSLNEDELIKDSFLSFDIVNILFPNDLRIGENYPNYPLGSIGNEVSKIPSQSDNNTLKDTDTFTKKKRKSRRKNDNEYLRKDNIKEKIKRRFFNIYLINKLEALRKKIKFKNYFCKFPSFFAKDVHRNRNKAILTLTLREIFEKEELYNYENENGLKNYKHNLIIVQTKEIKEDEEFKKILNKTFYELYKEYLDDFKIEENKNLKNKRENDNYIETYNNLMDNLMEFFK